MTVVAPADRPRRLPGGRSPRSSSAGCPSSCTPGSRCGGTSGRTTSSSPTAPRANPLDLGYLFLVDAEPARIPLDRPSFGRRVLRPGYFTADTGDGIVTVGDTRAPVSFREGLHVLHVVVTGDYTHVEVERNLDLAPPCVTDVEIGLPR